MRIETLPGNSFFYTNQYVLYQPGESACLVVDPGELQSDTEQFLSANDLTPAAYLLTHPHLDHFSGLSSFMEQWPAPIWLHPDGRELYEAAPEQAAMFGLQKPRIPAVTNWFAPPQTVEIAGFELEIRHAPGHSPGCVVILFADDAAEDDARSVIAGDVLFSGSIGRSDLPGGNGAQLLNSIRQQLLTLPDPTRVYCGHGPSTTIGKERTTNPYLA